jgi:hypothetical protein
MGKFLRAARCLNKKKIVILWSGSDVFEAQEHFAAGKMDPWVADRIHWAVSPWLAEEVRAMGISCEYVQASFVQPVKVPLPLPDKFSVLVFVPGREKSDLYGLDKILEVADALRSVEFTLVGWQHRQALQAPPNLKVHGRVSDMNAFFERATIVWRPVRHDGLSFTVLEALAQGRHVLYSYAFPACVHVTDAAAAHKELQRLLDLHNSQALGLNEAGIQMIARDFSAETVRAELCKRWEEIILSPSPRIVRAHRSEEPTETLPL